MGRWPRAIDFDMPCIKMLSTNASQQHAKLGSMSALAHAKRKDMASGAVRLRRDWPCISNVGKTWPGRYGITTWRLNRRCSARDIRRPLGI